MNLYLGWTVLVGCVIVAIGYIILALCPDAEYSDPKLSESGCRVIGCLLTVIGAVVAVFPILVFFSRLFWSIA